MFILLVPDVGYEMHYFVDNLLGERFILLVPDVGYGKHDFR